MSNTHHRRTLFSHSPLCTYCGCTTQLDARENSSNFATVDHVIPRARGGSGKRDNLVLACLKCNQEKGDNLPGHLRNDPKIKALYPKRCSVVRVYGQPSRVWIEECNNQWIKERLAGYALPG